MKKSKGYLIKLITLLVIFFYGCKEDIGIVSPSYTPKELLGTWELKSGGPVFWKYLIISNENVYYELNSLEDNRHSIKQGTYSITDNHIILARRLYTFSLNNDTLKLSEGDAVKTFIKNDKAPSKDEWVIPVTVIKEISVPFFSDITYDGLFFWGIGSDDILKFDTLGNVLVSFTIPTSGGIAYGNNMLWISNYDTIKAVNPATGEIISSLLIQSVNHINELSYESGFFWAFDTYFDGSGNTRIVKINESSGEVVKRLKIPFAAAVEFQGGKIWVTEGMNYYLPFYLYTVDPTNGKVLDSYLIERYFLEWKSLAFDGKNMWAFVNNSLIKLNIP